MGASGKSELGKMKVVFLPSLWSSLLSLWSWVAAICPFIFNEVREWDAKSCHMTARSKQSFCES